MSCIKNPITTLILKIIFSHVGLCVLVFGYIVGGAYLFQYIEGEAERDRFEKMFNKTKNITAHRQMLIEDIKEMYNSISGANDNETDAVIKEVQEMLEGYHRHIKLVMNETNDWTRAVYTGKDDQVPNYGWETLSAILFASTIMTTIGYGHITPVTDTGFMVCIIYSVFAIPLLSMFVVNITTVLCQSIRMLYHRGICCHLERRRHLEHFKAHVNTNIEYNPEVYRQIYDHRRRTAWAQAERMNHRQELDLTKYQPDNLVPASLAVIFWVIYLVGGAILFQATEDGWSMVEAFYFVVVTLFTIGFGDVIPGLKQGNTAKGQMLFGIVSVYIVAGLALTGSVTRLAFDAFKEHMGRGRRLLAEKAEALKLSRKKLLTRDDLYDKNERADHVLTRDELYDKDERPEHVSVAPVPYPYGGRS